jgi:hypothetical protein
MMSRILPVIVVVLVALLLLGRAGRERAETPAAGPDPVAQSAAATSVDRAPGPAGRRDSAPTGSATPAIDQLVILANRQRIDRERRYTYIDSLLVSSDSLIRRWADRDGRPLRVALVESPDLAGWRVMLPTIARRAFAAWQEVYPELRFEVVGEGEPTEITVRWIERFELERTGQTDLQYLPNGAIQRADVILALTTHDSLPLRDDGLLAVATHEVGHALGLPHSASPEDVLYPETRTARISQRDRATLVLLYAVAVGSLRLTP